jgi:hypothetical protein
VSAPVPRRPRLARSLGRDQMRIRRLEVEGRAFSSVRCGWADYSVPSTIGGTAAADWPPDFSTLASANDTIGCSVTSDHLVIPVGWDWWANVHFSIETAGAPVAGDFLIWNPRNVAGIGEYRYEPLFDSSASQQYFAATIFGAAGTEGDTIHLDGDVYTALGTTFVPQGFGIDLMALGPFDCGPSRFIS